MNFLPEDDVDYLRRKEFVHELKSSPNAIVLLEFGVPPNLFTHVDQKIVPLAVCRMAILIPEGYSTTKLDSFYTFPNLVRADGTLPNCATGQNEFWGEKWQFWSRHLDTADWKAGIDSLETYLLYVCAELKKV